MKKNKFFTILILLFSCFLFISQASALDLGVKESGELSKAVQKAGYDTNTDQTTFAITIGLVVRGALSFVGVIFLVLMVYAGYLWMTARGEEEQIKKAQKIIISSIIGLIITVSAYSITSFVVPTVLDRTAGGSYNTPAE